MPAQAPTDRAPVHLLVVGAGAIGRTHIDRILRTPGLALAGIADPSDAGRALAESLGAPWAADHLSALDRFQPQGAIVATPNPAHVPMALDCLVRGVATLVEKPVADTVAEAQVLVDAQACRCWWATTAATTRSTARRARSWPAGGWAASSPPT